MAEENFLEDVDDLVLFPDMMPDIGGKTFLFAWENRPEWVDFTLSWNKSTGIFKRWHLYCKRRKSLS